VGGTKEGKTKEEFKGLGKEGKNSNIKKGVYKGGQKGFVFQGRSGKELKCVRGGERRRKRKKNSTEEGGTIFKKKCRLGKDLEWTNSDKNPSTTGKKDLWGRNISLQKAHGLP